MSVLFVLVPTALLLSALAVAAFVWAARSGQLDDLKTPALRILYEEARPVRGSKATGQRTAEEDA
jgi:cbb3-type cytochrome oxidase maturation protein